MGFCAFLGSVVNLAIVGIETFGALTGPDDNAGRISLPSGSAAGDIAVLHDCVYRFDANNPTTAIPSGATSIVNTTTSTADERGRAIFSYKILSAGDISNGYLTGMGYQGVLTQIRKALFVLRADDSFTTITISTPGGQGTTGDPSAQTISAAGQDVPVTVFSGAVGNGGGSVGLTSSPAMTTTVTVTLVTPTNIDSMAGYRIYNSSPADHLVDSGDKGNTNILQSFYLKVS